MRIHRKSILNFLLLITLGIFVFSCKQSPDAKKVNENAGLLPSDHNSLQIKRYELALFGLDPSNLRPGIDKIYPDFKVFLGENWQDTMNMIRLYNYLTDNEIQEIFAEVKKQYPDVEFLRPAIGNAFSLIRESFPHVKDPLVFTYVSGLDIDNPAIYNDSVLIIALDDFLGSHAEVYKKAGIPVYKTLRMNPDNLIPAALTVVVRSLVRMDETKMTLLDQMIAEGKTLYYLDKLLPDVPEELKAGYTSQQLEWCRSNEANVWGYMVENHYLYSTDVQASVKFINDAPFTSGLVKESPGRLGAWTGWQIVKAYMNRNSGISLKELFENTDAQGILAQSGYRPRK